LSAPSPRAAAATAEAAAPGGAHPLYDRADLYDLAFSWDPALEAAFYADLLGPGRLLDVGCGTGRILAALAARGRLVIGLERSEAMAAAARARGLEVVIGDMCDFRLGGARGAAFCDGALSHLSTFRYLLEDAHVRAHLDAMAAALPARGARYAIDHDLVGRDYNPAHPGQRWTVRAGGFDVTASWRALGFPRNGRVLEEAWIRVTGAGELRHIEELRAWTLHEFVRAIECHGAFEIERWFAAPFEVAAPFRPVPWAPRDDETRRVVTVLRRR
jgi:SAM-dependent methyltransferase